ncbi:Asp23/Gls24 family envelope stress response protein [Streptomyces sp. H10-C2]|uniref:Asp23/Gls24 family envelope stress response protein n=1 Tax=unclassified Streptomyces TaxID=2593676 RepID=UPI0024B9CF03|nr:MULTISPECIES: Asp23/Gls24 family envelope stress response protein [unclassified Streptomyces]MDJ0346768.1 Asp23/Gls24 family envelope stress response protein [Streptomyces sp. PH10-H1]MDJ0374078.1 Asp23/Gls24 family envelope stress response protein [Streptomyces sp. H10-C2]
MTDTEGPNRPETAHSKSVGERGRKTVGGGHGSDSGSRGSTTIADGVVAKIAGMAARDVPGVHTMGGGFARGMGTMRDRVPGAGAKSVTSGVKVEVGDVQTAVDLEIVVEYGVSIIDVAGDVRENVITAIERMTGLEVIEVNIAVSDVKLPDEEEEQAESRVE